MSSTTTASAVTVTEPGDRSVLQVREQPVAPPGPGEAQVEVAAAGGSRIVAVRVGLFAEGRVEVRGDGLVEGLAVGVPR